MGFEQQEGTTSSKLAEAKTLPEEVMAKPRWLGALRRADEDECIRFPG